MEAGTTSHAIGTDYETLVIHISLAQAIVGVLPTGRHGDALAGVELGTGRPLHGTTLQLLLTMVVGRGLFVIEIVEADIHAQGIHRVVAHTHREQGGNISRHLHAISILAGSLLHLAVKLLFDHAHGANDTRIAELVLSIFQSVGQCLGLSHALLHGLCSNRLCHSSTKIVLKVTD